MAEVETNSEAVPVGGTAHLNGVTPQAETPSMDETQSPEVQGQPVDQVQVHTQHAMIEEMMQDHAFVEPELYRQHATADQMIQNHNVNYVGSQAPQIPLDDTTMDNAVNQAEPTPQHDAADQMMHERDFDEAEPQSQHDGMAPDHTISRVEFQQQRARVERTISEQSQSMAPADRVASISQAEELFPDATTYPTESLAMNQGSNLTADPSAPPAETSPTGWLVPPAQKSTPRISFEDYLALSEITFEWGDSYDDKDWMRLRAILAPTLMVDYTEVNGHKWEHMPAEDFVGIMSHIGFVGDPLVHTQHHIGASKWQKINDEEAIGHHQLRAAHQRYTAADLKTVENKGHGHAMVRHYYKKIEGEWKLGGLKPTVRWNEFEFEKIFKGF